MSGRKDFVVKKTICWECNNACGGCCWSRCFEPVPDWEATPTKVYQAEGHYEDSYIVHKCPNFERDSEVYYTQINQGELAKRLEVTPKTVGRMTDGFLRVQCQKKGFKIKISYQNKRRMTYIIHGNLVEKKKDFPHISKELLKMFWNNQKGYTCF